MKVKIFLFYWKANFVDPAFSSEWLGGKISVKKETQAKQGVKVSL